MSSKQGFAKPALLVLFLTGLLVATISVVSIKNSVSTFAEAQGANSVDKTTYQGILAKIDTKCVKTNNALCYKLFLDDGKTTFWVKPSSTQQRISLDNKLGSRVSIKTEDTPQDANTSGYITASKISYAPIDSKFTLGLGGGFDYVGNTNQEGDGNGFWHADLGIKTLAPGLYWTAVQSDPSTFIDSGFPDSAIANCVAKGYRCTLVVDPDGWPAWMGSYHDAASSPTKLGYLKAFAQKLSSRYGTKVDAYVLLNEPDINGVTPLDFSKLQTAFYTGIKAGNPQARVALSQLSTVDPNPSGHVTTQWIKDLLALEPAGQPFYDVMNIHHYQVYDFLWQAYDTYAQGGIRGLVSWINTKSTNGKRPIIITELGSDMKTDPVSNKLQAQNLFKLFAQAQSLPNVEYAQFYTLANYCVPDGNGGLSCYNCEFKPPADPGRCYGLLFPANSHYTTSLVKRPAYDAFKTLSKELTGLKFLKLDVSNPSLIEGYIFTDPTFGTKKEVIWKRPGTPEISTLKTFKANQVRVVNITGAETRVSGTAGVRITEEPVIIDFSQEALD